MDFLSPSSSSSMLGQFYPEEEDEIFQILNCNPPTQLQPHDHHQINPTQYHDHDLELDNLLLQIQDPHHELLDANNNNNNDNNHEQRRKTSSLLGLDDDDNHESKKDKTTTNDKKKRQKTIHREIERQRRLEMTSLHANLRSLLPLDFVKGKRSTSDHLDMTVKYIKHMQEKIQGLSDKRDALTKSEVPNKPKIGHKVIVNNCQAGVEVIFSTSNCCVSGDDQDQLLLSKMLQCLTIQGLDVISCISNRINNKLVHSIQAQAGDGRSFAIDAKELQQKLANV